MTEKAILKQIEGTQFQADMGVDLNVNGNAMPRGYWNLICSIRDVGLFCKGMKVTASWKFGPVKAYFGCKGNKHSVLEQLRAYRHLLMCLRNKSCSCK
jgi:hypothetical protein